jgi:hypothetical protein
MMNTAAVARFKIFPAFVRRMSRGSRNLVPMARRTAKSRTGILVPIPKRTGYPKEDFASTARGIRLPQNRAAETGQKARARRIPKRKGPSYFLSAQDIRYSGRGNKGWKRQGHFNYIQEVKTKDHEKGTQDSVHVFLKKFGKIRYIDQGRYRQGADDKIGRASPQRIGHPRRENRGSVDGMP